MPSRADAAHIKAQDKVIASGKKLVDQEKFKREQHPFDAYPRLKQQALDNAPPTPADNFRWRYFGLFYVAPAQDSYMCRLRLPNGILKHWQFAGIAELAERRYRSAGVDRYQAIRPRVAFSHSQRPLADRTATQIQRRLRRCRQDRG